MSNSSLVDYIKLSPHYTRMTNKKNKKITIHHMAGNLSVEVCGAVFQTRQGSSNYGIGSDGRVGLYVDESNSSWCSSNQTNDRQAITIEVANDEIGGNWHVSDKALAKLIDLCVDICQRNDIECLNYTGDTDGNLTMHKWFAATACPGAYLESKFPYIANEVNKRLGVINKVIAEQGSKFKIGERVKLVSGAKYSNGKNIPSFVFRVTLYVREISGNYITISTLKSGAVTGVVHKKYLISLDNKEMSISPSPSTSTPTSKEENTDGLKVGDEVNLIVGAKYTTGKTVPNWIVKRTLYVRQVCSDGNVVVSIFKTGAITGTVSSKYLMKKTDTNIVVETNKSETTIDDFVVGDKVKLISGAKYINGRNVADFVFKKTLYVRGINGDNITISIYKTGAITGIVHKKYLVKC